MLKGLYKIAGSDLTDNRDCNVYLVAADELVMIDAGFGAKSQALVDNILELDLNPADVKTIILTHCHIDHIRGASWFRDRFGSKLVMHQLDADVVERGDNRLTAAFCFEVLFEPLPIDIRLTGERGSLTLGNQEINWVHTPGHSAGSISVYLDDAGSRILFGQDMAAPLLPEFDCDPAAWFASMEKLLSLNADVLCDGHSGVYQPKEAVKRYIEYFVRLRRQEQA